MTSVPEISGGGILGTKVTEKRRKLDVFDLPPSTSSVSYISDEVMSVCPITGQPDFYKIEIWIGETNVGLESKSLKLYLQSFVDEGQFCEAFSDRIARDVKKATGGSVEVITEQKPRGGISIRSRSEIN